MRLGLPIDLPIHTRPGELTTREIRAMWQLRLSLIALKPTIAPEDDFARFHGFVARAVVMRALDKDGSVGAMLCYQPIDGAFRGQRYRLALFDYAFTAPRFRNRWDVALSHGRLFMGCRALAPGVRNYVGGVGYPRSAVLFARMAPNLRLDGDPRLDEFERHLLEIMCQRTAGLGFDARRRVVTMPTLPEPMDDAWAERHAANPILRGYLERVPEWRQGYAMAMLGRLDGGTLALAREIGRRVMSRPGQPTAHM